MNAHTKTNTSHSHCNTTMTVKAPIRFLNYLTTAICGFLGWTLLTDPDYFWGPVDGVMPYKFARPLLPAPATLHLDAATKCHLQGVGALMLAYFVLTPLCQPRTTYHTKATLRLKLIFYAWHTAFFVQYGWMVAPDPLLVQAFFRGMAVLTGSLTLALVGALRDASVPSGPTATTTAPAKRLVSLLVAPYVLPWALLFLWAPQQLSPAGRLPFFVASPSSSFDALQQCAFALDGIHLLATFQWHVDTVWHATPLAWYHVWPALLYTWPLVNAVRDPTGYVDRSKYRVLLGLHLAFVVLVWQTLTVPPLPEKKPKVVGTVKLYKTEAVHTSIIIPPLTEEEKVTKVD